MPDRKLIEAQVVFGMFPESALVTEAQGVIIKDAVANRVRRADQKERASQPRGPRGPKKIMQALNAKLKVDPERRTALWLCACEAMVANEVDGAVFYLNSEQENALLATYDKNGCAAAKFPVVMEIDGKPRHIKVRSLYDYFMEPVKP